MNTTTFTKLRNGSWGVRSVVAVQAGDVVSVVKKNGQAVPATIGSVVWAGQGVWLCSIAAERAAAHVVPSRVARRRVDTRVDTIDAEAAYEIAMERESERRFERGAELAFEGYSDDNGCF